MGAECRRDGLEMDNSPSFNPCKIEPKTQRAPDSFCLVYLSYLYSVSNVDNVEMFS